MSDANVVDYAEVVPIVNSVTGGKLSPGKAIGWYIQHKELIDKVLGFLKGLRRHKDKESPAPAPAPVTLEVPAPTSQPAPRTTSKPPVTGPSIISRLVFKLFFIEAWTDGPGSAQIMRKDAFDRVRSGENAIGRGSRIHYNGTPYDANGQEIGPDDPRHEQVAEGQQYVEIQGRYDGVEGDWVPANTGAMFGPLELHSYDDDYGLTPVVKVPADEQEGRKEFTARIRVKGTNVVSDWAEPIYIS